MTDNNRNDDPTQNPQGNPVPPSEGTGVKRPDQNKDEPGRETPPHSTGGEGAAGAGGPGGFGT